ncbi:hypothetical protein ACTJNK_13675 [Achromobacter anxifer]
MDDLKHKSLNEKLLEASRRGDTKAVKSLLEQGAIPSHDAFFVSGIREHVAVVQELLAGGLKINYDRAFKSAVNQNLMRMAKFLFGYCSREIHDPILSVASEQGNIDLVELMLDQGASPEVAKRCGTQEVKDFCKAYELRSMLGQKLKSHAPNKSKSPKLKI